MIKKKDKEKKIYKQYFFSREALENLVGRRNVRDYLIDLIDKDMRNYVDIEIKPGLAIPTEVNAIIDPELKFFVVPADWVKGKKDFTPQERANVLAEVWNISQPVPLKAQVEQKEEVKNGKEEIVES